MTLLLEFEQSLVSQLFWPTRSVEQFATAQRVLFPEKKSNISFNEQPMFQVVTQRIMARWRMGCQF